MELVVTMRIRLITVLCLLVLSRRTVRCRPLTQQWKQQQQANDGEAAYVTGDRHADTSDKDALSIPLPTRSLKNKNDSTRPLTILESYQF
jgi:hypothetical protein